MPRPGPFRRRSRPGDDHPGAGHRRIGTSPPRTGNRAQSHSGSGRSSAVSAEAPSTRALRHVDAPDARSVWGCGRESSPAWLGSCGGRIGQLPGQEAGASVSEPGGRPDPVSRDSWVVTTVFYPIGGMELALPRGGMVP